MKKRSQSLAWILTAASASMLMACGGGGGGSSNSSTAQHTGSPTTPYSKYQGVWEDKCEQIIENTGVQGSYKSTFAFADKSVKLVEAYYSTDNCSGNEISTMSYPAYSLAITSSPNPLVDQVEIKTAGGAVEGTGVAYQGQNADGSRFWVIPFDKGSPFYVAAQKSPESVTGTASFAPDQKSFTLTDGADGKQFIQLTKRL